MEIKLYEREKHKPIAFENLMWNDFFTLPIISTIPVGTWKIYKCVPEFQCKGDDGVIHNYNAVWLNVRQNNLRPFHFFEPSQTVYRIIAETFEVSVEW